MTRVRGGAYRTPVVPFNVDLLEVKMETLVKQAGSSGVWHFGVYERIPRSRQPNARGLVACSPVLLHILEEAPAGEVNYKDMKQINMNLIKNPRACAKELAFGGVLRWEHG